MKKPTKQKTIKKMKIIGKEEYVNQKTGEVEQFQTIKMESRDFNFDKIWIAHVLESLEAIGNQKMKVMSELLRLKNRDNLVLTTQKELAENINVSRPVISETLNILIESNFIKKVRNGCYMINPDHLFKGTNNNRLNVLLEYSKPEETEETKVGDNPDTFVQTKKEK